MRPLETEALVRAENRALRVSRNDAVHMLAEQVKESDAILAPLSNRPTLARGLGIDRLGEAGCGVGTWSILVLARGAQRLPVRRGHYRLTERFQVPAARWSPAGAPIESLSQIWAAGESFAGEPGMQSRGRTRPCEVSAAGHWFLGERG